MDIARSTGTPPITIPVRRRERRQKRGCRAGMLQKQPYKPQLPSLFLTNARSMANKMDEMIIKGSCILFTTETWHHSCILDSAIELAGYTAQHHDRTSASGKSTGGGLCLYVNNNWCTNIVTVKSYCSPDLEYVTVKCRSIYLPREFTVHHNCCLHHTGCEC